MVEHSRTYRLEQLKQRNPELAEFGVNVYLLEGWQLFLFIAQNCELLVGDASQVDAWFSACHAGIWRSHHFNQFLLDQGIPVAQKTYSRRDEPSHGLDYFSLAIRMAGGTIENGVMTPENFDLGFKNLVIFVSSDEVLAKRIQDMLAKSISTILKMNPDNSAQGLNVFIIAEDENQFTEKKNYFLAMLANALRTDEISDKLDEKYNELHGLRKYDLSLTEN